MRKTRILWCGEFSELNTGYSVYAKNLLSRLHATGKYNICELANYYGYNNAGNERANNIPWTVVGNDANHSNPNEVNECNSDIMNQFGKWRFDKVSTWFKPDVCATVLDIWMFEHMIMSHLRPYYKLLAMPAVDATPQQPDWIDKYSKCDGILSYTDWALEVLKKQSGGMIKTVGNASPAADETAFFPIQNRAEHKIKFGLPPDSFIIGVVARNQKRKLYHDLFEAFRTLLDKLPKNLAERVFLLCHTSIPDCGFNIARLLREHKVGNKVLFTTICRQTGAIYPSFYQTPRCISPQTNQPTAGYPNTQFGVDAKNLGMIMNCFDIFVQFSSLEACGMPQIEAAACGVPVFAVDYSGMSEIVQKTNGYAIPVKRFSRETETGRLWAYPDNDRFVDLVLGYLKMPEIFWETKRAETYKKYKEHYSWDKAAEMWMSAMDAELRPLERWMQQPRVFQPNINPPQGMNNENAVCWAIENILGLPERLHTYWAACLVDHLDFGAVPSFGNLNITDLSFLGLKTGFREYTQQVMFQDMLEERNRINKTELARCSNSPLPDYITRAHIGEYYE